MKDTLKAGLQRYCENHSSGAPSYLRIIERNTHLRTTKAQDASDFIQGRLLSFISKLIKPSRILDIGTFTAYSACCLAEGLPDGAVLTTVEGNPLYAAIIREHIELAGMSDKVQLVIGQALDILTQLPGPWDLIFLDANKLEYSAYYEQVIEKTRPGGVIIADNILWKSQVIEKEKDKKTQALDQFNNLVREDSRVENFILPYRDGLNIIRKLP